METSGRRRRDARCGVPALWLHASPHQQCGAVAAAVVLVVLAALASLEPAVRPAAAAVLVVEAVLLTRFRARVRRWRRREQRLAQEAARGQRALEAWLASRERA